MLFYLFDETWTKGLSGRVPLVSYLLLTHSYNNFFETLSVSDVNPPDSIEKKNPEVGLFIIYASSGRHGGSVR